MEGLLRKTDEQQNPRQYIPSPKNPTCCSGSQWGKLIKTVELTPKNNYEYGKRIHESPKKLILNPDLSKKTQIHT